MSNQPQEKQESFTEIAQLKKEADDLMSDLESKMKSLSNAALFFFEEAKAYSDRAHDITDLSYKILKDDDGKDVMDPTNTMVLIKLFAFEEKNEDIFREKMELAIMELEYGLHKMRTRIKRKIAKTKKARKVGQNI